jgi:HSP20 family protein
MAIIRKRDQGQEMQNERQMPTMFDPWRMMRDVLQWDPFREMQFRRREGEFMPRFEVKESPNAFIFRADLPGIRTDDLDISMVGNRLTVTGRREMEERRDEETYHAMEVEYGEFTRSFTLPEGVDQDNVRADFTNGVLTLTVAKRPEAQPKRVQISSGGGQQGTNPTVSGKQTSKA